MQTTTQMSRITQLPEDHLRAFVGQASDAELVAYWGPNAAAIRKMAREQVAARRQGDSMIILLPGLMGSTLEDIGDDPQLLWINPLAYMRGQANRLDLAPDGVTDALPGVKVRARGLVWLVYAKMLLRLQRDYEVYTFPYDWRRATWDVVPQLRAFIDQKIAASPFKQVTLVGHSLGGLLAIDYLIGQQTRAHAERHLKRVIALGTPFRGALPAVSILARGDEPKLRLIKALNPQNDPLRMLRTFPSLYEILPAPKGLYPDWDPVPEQDIWDASTWEHQGVTIHRDHLARALKHHEALSKADPQVPIEIVAGALYETPTGLDGDLLRGIIRKMWEGLAGGDGTVPIASARFGDRPAYYVHEVHVELVLENSVIDGVADWVEGGQPDRLEQRVEDVIRVDGPLREAMLVVPESVAETVSADRIAQKVMADEPLNHEELKALQTLI